ncbi:TetR/AcrR family transcriptional regulator [Kineosporia babensis]|uniref:TetR/AcrR family transcriptional regulator n=1 Tax=Kineosporia babensis TaxID=499548 RepID=A0A9X1NDQ2_9ACTN|nr:TetR/AcrR family transcriptional regulator [Kineosporia babensis]MCD5313087.1 TetR/AcrR family transcriptional regulator [Kineosporia babensis]
MEDVPASVSVGGPVGEATDGVVAPGAPAAVGDDLPSGENPTRKGRKRARVTSRTPSADLKGALTDAAEAVLMRDGAQAVTVRAVASEAGVAPMGVYNRFGSKDGLIEALLVRGFQGLTAAISAREGETDPVLRLWMSGSRYREFALSHPSHYALMFGDRVGQDWQPSAEFGECAEAAFQILADHVVTLIAAGIFTEGDPVMLARQVWSAVHGAVALEMGGLLDPEAADTSYRQLLGMILRGLAEPGTLAFDHPQEPPKVVRNRP